MIKSIFKSGWDKLKTLHKDDKGAVLMITLAVFLFLYMVCSATYAVGTVIHEKIQLQNACDAAAYSAAIVEADGLSRIATINRAMSWTYVQTTRMHMDYIVHRWLELTANRFIQDRSDCRSFNQNRCWDVVPVRGGGVWIPEPCSKNRAVKTGLLSVWVIPAKSTNVPAITAAFELWSFWRKNWVFGSTS